MPAVAPTEPTTAAPEETQKETSTEEAPVPAETAEKAEKAEKVKEETVKEEEEVTVKQECCVCYKQPHDSWTFSSAGMKGVYCTSALFL